MNSACHMLRLHDVVNFARLPSQNYGKAHISAAVPADSLVNSGSAPSTLPNTVSKHRQTLFAQVSFMWLLGQICLPVGFLYIMRPCLRYSRPYCTEGEGGLYRDYFAIPKLQHLHYTADAPKFRWGKFCHLHERRTFPMKVSPHEVPPHPCIDLYTAIAVNSVLS